LAIIEEALNRCTVLSRCAAMRPWLTTFPLDEVQLLTKTCRLYYYELGYTQQALAACLRFFNIG
jgi:hypothetical protein